MCVCVSVCIHMYVCVIKRDESMCDDPETMDWDASSVTPVVAAKPDVCMYINV